MRPVSLNHFLKRKRLGDRQGQRLLAVHVLAGPECLDRHLGMPVVGCGDEQTIERRVVDQLAELLRFGLEVPEPSLAHHLRGALAMSGIHVAAQGEGQLSRFDAGA